MIPITAPPLPSLAAQKKQPPASLKKLTSSPKNRVWNFLKTPSGRSGKNSAADVATAIGSVQYSYKTASGQEQHPEYDPFGNVIASTGTLSQPYQWSSKENDGNGLTYYLYRFYNPSLGRWVNRDPIDELGTVINVELLTEDIERNIKLLNRKTKILNILASLTIMETKLKNRIELMMSWISRDFIAERGEINLYQFVEDNPVYGVDPIGFFVTNSSWDFETARRAGAAADLIFALSVDSNHNGFGPEASGLVCKKCDKPIFGYTGPVLGAVINQGKIRTQSQPGKDPCPNGWNTVGIHYAHPSGSGIPGIDTGWAKAGHPGIPPNMPLTLATPSSPVTPHNPYPPPKYEDSDPPKYPHSVP